MKRQRTLALAFRAVKSNKVRTGITVAIIAFGIMAMVGINTAIDAMKQKFTESFSGMGANGFTIHYREWRMGFDGGSDVKKKKKGQRTVRKSSTDKPITLLQAETFEERFQYPAKIGITTNEANDAEISLRGKQTNPNLNLSKGDW